MKKTKITCDGCEDEIFERYFLVIDTRNPSERDNKHYCKKCWEKMEIDEHLPTGIDFGRKGLPIK